MPHRDPERRRAATLAWKDARRPSPEVQPDGLPASGVVQFSPDGTKICCHACGRWFGSLNSHIKTHGMDFDSYRETYELARTVSLWPASLQEKQRQAALDRDQGSIGRQSLPPAKPRQAGTPTRLSSKVNSSKSRIGKPPRRAVIICGH